jgi:pimeloyl-ACP methyl ester carboxylesterase
LLRLLPRSADPVTAPAIVREIADAHLPTSVAALAAELRGLKETFEATRDTGVSGARPLVVLTAGEPTPAVTLRQMGMDAAQGERMRTEWIRMQRERAAWSATGRHELVEDAGHYVQFDRPDAVIRAVREMLVLAGSSTHSTQR